MTSNWSRWLTIVVAGCVAAGVIVYVDNWAFEGEVTPIVVVALLLAATTVASAVWGRRGWIAIAIVWGAVPVAHLVKHVLGLPDTLHPNTYMSILLLAGFTLVVAVIGGGCGAFMRWLATGLVRRKEDPR